MVVWGLFDLNLPLVAIDDSTINKLKLNEQYDLKRIKLQFKSDNDRTE